MKLLAALSYIGSFPFATAFPKPTDSMGIGTSGCKSGGESISQYISLQNTICADSSPVFAVEKLPINTRVAECRENGETRYDCPNDFRITARPATPSVAQTVSWNIEDALSAEYATQIPPLAVEKRDISEQEGQDDRENKRYECSNSRVGVLVCRYGFCAIDYYCEEGMRCSDECACCRDASMVEVEMDAVV